jgi:hypothetical protein
MIESLLLFSIVVHWGFSLGAYLALRTEISTVRFLLIIIWIWILTKNIV